MLLSHFLSILERDLLHCWVEVAFVPTQGQDKGVWVVVVIVQHFVDPIEHWIETLLVRYVITNDGSSCIFVIQGYHASEFLRTSCVPYVHLNLSAIPTSSLSVLLLVAKSHSLLKVSSTYGHIMTLWEDASTEALGYTGLAYTWVTQEYHFGFHDRASAWVSLLHLLRWRERVWHSKATFVFVLRSWLRALATTTAATSTWRLHYSTKLILY